MADLSSPAQIRARLVSGLAAEDLIRLELTVRGALEAPEGEQRREAIVVGLSLWGLQYMRYLRWLMETVPDVYDPVAEAANEVVLAWARSQLATRRADEADVRAQYFLDAMESEPSLAAVAAKNVLKLAPGHPLRDEQRIRDSLERVLDRAIDQAVMADADERTLEYETGLALSAIAGLLEHGLVSERRANSLIAVGRSLLSSPHVGDEADIFRLAAAAALARRAMSAQRRGELELARRLSADIAVLAGPVRDAGTDPVHGTLLAMVQEHFEGQGEGASRAGEGLPGACAASAPDDPVALAASQIAARQAMRDRDYRQVIDKLAPLLPTLEDRYLSAVVDQDVAMAGVQMSNAAVDLAFAYAHADDFGSAIATLDRAKSLRFRYQALLRASPMGESLRDLERDIQRVAGGGAAPDEHAAGRHTWAQTLTGLQEAYRQVRDRVGDRGLPRPGVREVARRLTEDEAVVVLGCGRDDELLLAIIRRSDRTAPSHAEVLPPESGAEMSGAMIDTRLGWQTWLAFQLPDVLPGPALSYLLHTAERLVGARLEPLLARWDVRRVTIVAHKLLHLVPWWALPSLARYEVMTASSLGHLVATRPQRGKQRALHREVESRALVVANPTGDLPLTAGEAARVVRHLRSMGCETDLVQASDAIQPELVARMSSSAILHFSGHGRSDQMTPMRSALELSLGGVSGGDLLRELADSADWQPVHRLIGDKWQVSPQERRADLPGQGRLEEKFWPVSERIELRLERADQTLLGRYALAGFAEDDEPVYGARRRVSALWTAGEMLIAGCFDHCRLAFLSACEAGVGGLPLVDEFAGLPAGLQVAGVSTVISPLWPVGSDAAAIVAELFYDALAGAGAEVDVLALVHRVRHRLRTMTREEAAATLRRIRDAAEEPTARFQLEAACWSLLRREEPHPFSHPYHWAAFQVTGAPVLKLPFARSRGQDAAVPHMAAGPPDSFELPPLPDEVVSGGGAQSWDRDPFEAARSAEFLAVSTGDPALQVLAADLVYERGAAHQRAGELELAAADFARAVDLNPGQVEARVQLAWRSAGRGDHAGALALSDAVLEQVPEHEVARLLRSFAHRALGQAAAARADLDHVLSTGTDEQVRSLAHRTRAQLLAAEGAHEAALQDLAESIRLQPEESQTYLQRVDLELELERWQAALADAGRALFLAPNDPAAHATMAQALAGAGRRREAAGAYERAIELRPGEQSYHYHLAMTLSDLEEYQHALDSFDRALDIGPPASEIYTNRGLVHGAMGNWDRALADHQSALDLDPGDFAARYNRACAQSMKGESGTVVQDLATVFAQEPSLRAHALADSDLEWARSHLPAVQELLADRG